MTALIAFFPFSANHRRPAIVSFLDVTVITFDLFHRFGYIQCENKCSWQYPIYLINS